MINTGRSIYSVEKVLKRFHENSSSRIESWSDCHNAFCAVQERGYQETDKELLALHLVGFLASYGMYRGSSPLLQKYKYLIHEGVIKIIFDEAYSDLFNLDAAKFGEKIEKIEEVYNKIKLYYKDVGFFASRTLITKILFVTYCCVPAYDTFFINGLSKYGIKKYSFSKLNEWLTLNPKFIEDLKNGNNENHPFMKSVDMYFWQLGKTN